MKARLIYIAVLASLFAGSVIENLGLSDGNDW